MSIFVNLVIVNLLISIFIFLIPKDYFFAKKSSPIFWGLIIVLIMTVILAILTFKKESQDFPILRISLIFLFFGNVGFLAYYRREYFMKNGIFVEAIIINIKKLRIPDKNFKIISVSFRDNLSIDRISDLAVSPKEFDSLEIGQSINIFYVHSNSTMTEVISTKYLNQYFVKNRVFQEAIITDIVASKNSDTKTVFVQFKDNVKLERKAKISVSTSVYDSFQIGQRIGIFYCPKILTEVRLA